MYDADIKAEDVQCVGCITETGVHFNHCNVCEIRKCCRAKGYENCSLCEDFACTKLEDFFKFVPDAKITLENIRK